MIKILNAFKLIWTYSLDEKEKKNSRKYELLGRNELGISEFFKSLEVFSKGRKYSFK